MATPSPAQPRSRLIPPLPHTQRSSTRYTGNGGDLLRPNVDAACRPRRRPAAVIPPPAASPTHAARELYAALWRHAESARTQLVGALALLGSVFMVYQYAQQTAGRIGSMAGNFQGFSRIHTDYRSAPMKRPKH